MGFTKKSFTDPVRVPYTIDRYDADSRGNVTTTTHTVWFTMRRETQADADEVVRAQLLGGKSERDLKLDRFCSLLVAPPEGFDDFPADGEMAERARAYFDDPQMDTLIHAVMRFYERAVYPAQLFRGL